MTIKSILEMEELIVSGGETEVNETRNGSTLRVRYDGNVPVAIDTGAGLSYTIDGRNVDRYAALEWSIKTALPIAQPSARMLVRSRNGFQDSFGEAISNALKLFEVLDSLYSMDTVGLPTRQGMIRAAVRELVYVHNALRDMTEVGEAIPDVTDTTPVISPYDLHSLLKAKYLHRELDFVRGAINDPFIFASGQQPGVQIGCDMQQHAVLNFRKAQVVLGNRLSHLLSEDRY